MFLILAGFAVWAATLGWDNSILHRHPLRQSRTAMNALSLVRGGPWFAYEAWVLGPPWALPFELPVYQWTVAAAVTVSGVRLESMGRFVSEVFFWATLLPVWALLGSLRVRPTDRLLFFGIALASPLYLFWSRTFMIESTALFFCAVYLAWVVRSCTQPRLSRLVLVALVGSVAAMIKITTFSGFGICALVFAAARPQLRAKDRVVCIGLLVGVPVLSAAVWTMYAEAARTQAPLAAEFLTASSLRAWTVGWLSDRYSLATWRAVFGRSVTELIGGAWVLLAVVGAIAASHRRRVEVGCALGIFLAVVLLFPALHRVHDYYFYGNGFFLLAAVGFALLGLVETGGWQRAAGVVLFVAVVSTQISTYFAQVVPVQERSWTPRAALVSAIKKYTSPSDILLVYGQDWSPAIPYSADRKALMDREDRPLSARSVTASLQRLDAEGLLVGGVVVCGRSRDRARIAAESAIELGLGSAPRWRGRECSLYARRPPIERSRWRGDRLPQVGRLSTQSPPTSRSDGRSADERQA